jgi:hypothetical protein
MFLDQQLKFAKNGSKTYVFAFFKNVILRFLVEIRAKMAEKGPKKGSKTYVLGPKTRF